MPVELVDAPADGRIFATTRRVRLGDSSPGGRLRLDALARMLQDVSDDDTRSAGFEDAAGWVVRRTSIRVERFPAYLEVLQARTWCSGTGGRWAERRISLRGDDTSGGAATAGSGAPGAGDGTGEQDGPAGTPRHGGGTVDAATLWVHLDPETMRPLTLPASFHELFGEASGGRTVRATLHHEALPAELRASHPFVLRFTDFDVLGHVNNANYWVSVEEELARRRDLRAPLRAEVEHREAIEPGATVDVHVRDGEGTLELWLVDRTTRRVYASGRVEAER